MRRGVVVAAAVTVLMATRASGQTAADAPRFEVASVKTTDPFAQVRGGGGSVSFPLLGVHPQPGGRLQAVATLQSLILRAFGIKDYQLEGGPKWLTIDYFDITAKAGRETATEAEMNEMLKANLERSRRDGRRRDWSHWPHRRRRATVPN